MNLTLNEALLKGVEAHKSGNIKDADIYYTAILKAQPNHPDANHNMGVLAVGLKKTKEALPFFKRAIEFNPKIQQFWISYIDALIKLEKIDDAITELEKAKDNLLETKSLVQLEKRLKSLSNQFVRYKIKSKKNKTKVTSNFYDQKKLVQSLKIAKKKTELGLFQVSKKKSNIDNNKSTKLKDPPTEILQRLLKLYHERKFNEALEKIKLLKKKFPDSFNLNNLEGAAYKGLGKLNKAIECFKYSSSLNPKSGIPYNNIGNVLIELGKINEAHENFNQAIFLMPDFADAHFNLGNIFKDRGKLEEAISSYKKAVSYKTNFADAYNNMGNIFQIKGLFKEAINSYKKSLLIRPNYHDVYNNMGNALKQEGFIDEAISAYRKAIQLKSNYADAYNNLGIILKEQGNFREAIDAYKKALLLNPDFPDALSNMGNILRSLEFKKSDKDLTRIIISLLDKKTYVRPREIATAVISLLKQEIDFVKELDDLSIDENEIILSKCITKLSNSSMLLKFMTLASIPDIDIEKLFTKIRKNLTLTISNFTFSKEVIKFQSALALQCYSNEFIYVEQKEELVALAKLEELASANFLNKKQPNSETILCLASYKPLNQYKWHNKLKITNEIDEVFNRQITEPNLEIKLKSKISSFGKITDKISAKVRLQYEHSPYPRWINTALRLYPALISHEVDKFELKLFDTNIRSTKSPEILVAGCGTGEHSLATAARFKNSKVLAVDLSLSSLAYAKRKSEKLGFTNIKYIQTDILDLEKLNKKFDIIESVGVLHHMDNPILGLKILSKSLKKGGLLKIGLYSKLARQHIEQIIIEIENFKIKPNKIGMKRFRNKLFQSTKKSHLNIHSLSDFYNLSELKDLLFHVKEHRFTIPQIKENLYKFRLGFCGFEKSEITHNFKLENSTKGDLYNLDKWELFERKYPNTFIGMYQFWCQKIN